MNISTVGITGSHGFIGTHLLHELNKNNVNHVLFEGNLLNEKEVKKFFAKNKITTLIHLAGRFLPPFKKQVESNLLSTEALLRIGTAHGLERIIFTSSGAVYGNHHNMPANEDSTLLPNTDYGLTKKHAEDIITYYGRETDLRYVILRFSNVYGNSDKGVIHDMMESINTSKKVTIHGDGEQTRSFLHVSDACQSIIRALKYSKSDIFNISGPIVMSINKLVKELGKNYTFEIVHLPADNNLKNLSLDTSKARRLLHFEPTVTSLLIDHMK